MHVLGEEGDVYGTKIGSYMGQSGGESLVRKKLEQHEWEVVELYMNVKYLATHE